jgi:hypothetical protein
VDGQGRPTEAGGARLARQIAEALRGGAFDPQHAGDLFLRADAEQAIRQALGTGTPGLSIAVAGRDDARVRGVSFMGARYAPDLVVEPPGERPLAVTLTLLRGDAGPVAMALATALVLSVRYQAVVAFVLDRRLAKRDPFGSIEDDAPAAPERRALSDAERAFLDQLWERHRVLVEIRHQDPFGWG